MEYRSGAVEDMAQIMAEEMDPEGHDRAAVEEEVLNLILAEQEAGRLNEAELLERIVEALAPKDKRRQANLLMSVMDKVSPRAKGVGHPDVFGLTHDS